MAKKMIKTTAIKKNDSAAKNKSQNQGKLIVDGICPPADISYLTDLGLLNGARVHTEKIIDILYKPIKSQIKDHPRTYRNIAKKDYLLIAKQKRSPRNKQRQVIKKQLHYINRNLDHIQ